MNMNEEFASAPGQEMAGNYAQQPNGQVGYANPAGYPQQYAQQPNGQVGYANPAGYPQQYAQQPSGQVGYANPAGYPQQYAQQPSGQVGYANPAGYPQQYAQQPSGQVGYANPAGYPQQYAQQPSGQVGYANPAGYPQQYAQQPSEQAGYENPAGYPQQYAQQPSEQAGYDNPADYSQQYAQQPSEQAGYDNPAEYSQQYAQQPSEQAGYDNPAEYSQQYAQQPSEQAATQSESANPVTMADDDVQGVWNRYLSYCASCLKADMVAGLVPADGQRWTCIVDNYENVVSQGTRLLLLDENVNALVERMRPGQSLQYGWPMVALETREGLKVAPLFVLDMAPPPYPANSVAIFGDPVINPAVVRAVLPNAGDVEFLRTQLGAGMPEGNVAIQRYVENICKVLNLATQELNVYALSSGVPREAGVYNSAIVAIVEGMPSVRPVLEELRELATRQDWRGTAAGLLLGGGAGEGKGRTNMPVMPWSTDAEFEQGVQLVRNNSVTVFNMTQRDIVDQLFATVASNAWNDGEKALLLTDNEKRLGELLKLGKDIHDAMLVRPSCEADFAQNPKRAGRHLAELSVKLKDDIEATLVSLPTVVARVDKAIAESEEFRKVALAGAKRRDDLIKEKDVLEAKRVELAKKIWRNGLPSGNFEAGELGEEIKKLQGSWFCAGMRASSLLRRINANKNVTIQEVSDWCSTVASIKKVEEEINSLRDPDKYNVSTANYRWASEGIGLVSARVSVCLSENTKCLDGLVNTKNRDMQSRRAISDALSGLHCWCSDLGDVSHYFRLEAGMFDVLVLDNAHRYSLAQVLPLLYRAKRVAIVGDINAAAHVVFLDDEQLSTMANRFNFDRSAMMERCLDYSVGNVYAALSHV